MSSFVTSKGKGITINHFHNPTQFDFVIIQSAIPMNNWNRFDALYPLLHSTYMYEEWSGIKYKGIDKSIF